MPGELIPQLAREAQERPDRLALAFPPDASYTWAALYLLVRRLAGHFAARGVRPGDRLAILSESPREQTVAFLGAMAAGAVPTILSHPSIKQSIERFVPTVSALLGRSSIAHVVCAVDLVERAGAWLGRSVLPLPGDDQLDGPGMDPGAPAGGADTAFLQFSSGTTGMRKGVAVTGAMLRAQAVRYAAALGLGRDDTVVSWLPLYHDMGLVGALLIPMVAGAASVHISPFRWVQSPASILDLVAAHRATFAWFPNFCFRVLATRVPATFAGDLSSLKVLVNCGEPVRPGAFDAFLARFARCGLRPEALQCSYGMAENTFAITQTRPGAPPARDVIDRDRFHRDRLAVPASGGATIELLSCGTPIADHEVRIRLQGGAGAGALAGERQVGEIELRTPCLFTGYDAAPTGALDADGWFATGDQGYLAGGELYVSGRIKDLIIHRGVNLHPEDLEEVLGQVRGCKAGRAVVFGVYDEDAGTERIVALLEEVEDGAQGGRTGLMTRARGAMFEHFGVLPSDLVIVEPGALVKSTSGKPSRSANRELYLGGSFGSPPRR